VNQRQVKEKEQLKRNHIQLPWRVPIVSGKVFHPRSAQVATLVRQSHHSDEAKRLNAKVNAVLKGGGGRRRPTTAPEPVRAQPTREETRDHLVELLRELESAEHLVTQSVTPYQLDALAEVCARSAPSIFKREGALVACRRVLRGLVEKTETWISDIEDLMMMVEVYSTPRGTKEPS
jgi:hypothetical protein